MILELYLTPPRKDIEEWTTSVIFERLLPLRFRYAVSKSILLGLLFVPEFPEFA